jgi:uncharacterized lipoprotein YajG
LAEDVLLISRGSFAEIQIQEPEGQSTAMKFLNCKYFPILAVALMLAGCQQNPSPPVVVNPPAETKTSEETTVHKETKEVEKTSDGTPNPDGTVQTKKSEQTTTVERKTKQ